MEIMKHAVLPHILMFFFMISPACPSGDKNDLKSVMEARLEAFETLSADFIQEKKVSLFEEALISKGTIKIKRPFNICLQTSEPGSIIIYIGRKNLSILNEEGTIQNLPLNRVSGANSILGVLSDLTQNNWKKLEKNFTHETISGEPFSISLIPRKKGIKSKLEKITFTLAAGGKWIESMEMLEKNGDSLKMIFQKVRINPELPDSDFEPTGRPPDHPDLSR